MKNILIMGAGVYQVPLIKKVKEMGYRAVVVSPKGNYPGIDLADELIELDIRDKETVLERAKQIGILAVLTTGTDVAVPTIGYLVDELGLTGTGFKAAQRSMDKTLMKQCFFEHGVSTAKYYAIHSLNELKIKAKEIGYPVMVKAVDSSGSRGITKVSLEEDLPVAFAAARAVSNLQIVIVEEYLAGYEIGAQAVVINNEVVEVFLHSDETTPPPVSAPIGHAMPLILNSGLETKTKLLVKKAVKALGILNTISNVDIMIVNGEPYILEIGARMGATCLAENISIYAGFDAYEFIIHLALGTHSALPVVYVKQANAALLLKTNKTGVVKSLVIPKSTFSHPNLVDLSIDVKVGERVRAFKVGPDRMGHIIVKADTLEQSNNLVKCLASTIVIEIEE
jgi:biotin carboxylase